MTEEEAFIAAVCASPEDDLPRLVYADWLDEHSCPERAEFIRLQCHHERHGIKPDSRSGRRERELFVHPHFGGANVRSAVRGESRLPAGWEVHLPPGFGAGPTAHVRRGFVHTVHCPLAAWVGGGCGVCSGTGEADRVRAVRERADIPGLPPVACWSCSGTGTTPGVGRELVRSQPVQRVEVTDREPYLNAGGRFLWLVSTFHSNGSPRATSAVLPRDIWERLQGYNEFEYRRIGVKWWETAHAALDAFSAALLTWAKTPVPPGRR